MTKEELNKATANLRSLIEKKVGGLGKLEEQEKYDWGDLIKTKRKN